MNPKIKKVIDEIQRTKAKILELQTLLPELERKRIDMENTEIVKLVRSANILPAELPAFIESLKSPKNLMPTILPSDDDYSNEENHFNTEQSMED